MNTGAAASHLASATAERTIAFGPFRLLADRQLLLKDGQPVHVGSRALDILGALLRSAGAVVSKEQLFACAWPGSVVEESNLRAQVAVLRKALGDGRAGARYIVAVPGRGYRFVAPIASPGPAAAVAPAARANNLPVSLTQPIGRADVAIAIGERLQRRRLMTIVGPGGIGKTTVALMVAEAQAVCYDDGVCFVDLAPLADPLLVPGAVASALGLPIVSPDPTPRLLAWLDGKRMLLVLDSCEHLVEAAAVLAETLLKGAPSIHVLATSREPLRAEGESVHRLAPLEAPPPSPELTAAEALTFPAVALFVESAAAGIDGFALRDADAPIVADICRRLDGIALAIELAASRVDAFGLAGVAAHLDDRFRLLTAGRRTALPRHQTLVATLDWSHALLSEPERTSLRRLAIFAGGFTLKSAAVVVAGDGIEVPDVPDLVAHLVAKSLVQPDPGGSGMRYRLLDTMRAYALEKLKASGEFEQVARRHAEQFRSVFARAEIEWETQPAALWLAAYGSELDNVRGALDWTLSPAGDAAIGIALTTSAIPLWRHRSLMEECRARVDQALSRLALPAAGDRRREMQLLDARSAVLLMTNGPDRDQEAGWTRALAIAEQLGDVDYQLRALWGLSVIRFTNGDYRTALAFNTRLCAVAAHSPDPSDLVIGERMSAISMHVLGDQARARHHFERVLERAIAPVRRSHMIRFQFDHEMVAYGFYARVLWLQGYPDQALAAAARSVERARVLDHPASLLHALVNAGCPVALLAGDMPATERYVAMLLELAARSAFTPWEVKGQCYRAVLMIKRGDAAAGARLLRAALGRLSDTAFHLQYTAFLADLADGLGQSGEMEAALGTVDDALARALRNEERWCLAELLRLRGELLLRRGGPDAPAMAADLFQQALEAARRQGASSWMLRAATSLARLRRDQGHAADARQLLAPVLAGFSEGFGTADLKAAETLLRLSL